MAFFSLIKPKQSELPTLWVHNTMSGSLEVFKPLNSTVRLYNCGPTVYDQSHIGNLRGPLLANVLRRTLERWGYSVKHVSNITDVGHLTGDNEGDADVGEDRIEASARKQGLSAQDIAREYTDAFYKDLDLLGIDLKKILFAPATHYIGEQIALVKTLEEKGYAYKIQDGVYFDTSKFPSYGKLGNVDLAQLREGARVEENKDKKNPHDFALWKFSKPNERRQQEWESPWGVGFPGWHIECTAMIFKLLGRQIDIHMGGVDLIPIHHNNELAQAEAITGKQFVRYWMHNALITIEGKRVSKSLGNTVYLHNIVDKGLSPLSLRYLFLTAHYRSPMNFTWDAVEAADTALTRLNRSFLELPKASGKSEPSFLKEFYAAIADDLDTPKALARVWELLRDETVSLANKRASLLEADRILGLGFSEMRPVAKLQVKASQLPQDVQQMLTERESARMERNFQKADELRLKIEEAGFDIQDTPQGAKVSPKEKQ